MKITRTSPFGTGVSTMEIDVTEDQLNKWQQGGLIQNVMPNLTADEREFIMTGITHNDWDEIFG